MGIFYPLSSLNAREYWWFRDYILKHSKRRQEEHVTNWQKILLRDSGTKWWNSYPAKCSVINLYYINLNQSNFIKHALCVCFLLYIINVEQCESDTTQTVLSIEIPNIYLVFLSKVPKIIKVNLLHFSTLKTSKREYLTTYLSTYIINTLYLDVHR